MRDIKMEFRLMLSSMKDDDFYTLLNNCLEFRVQSEGVVTEKNLRDSIEKAIQPFFDKIYKEDKLLDQPLSYDIIDYIKWIIEEGACRWLYAQCENKIKEKREKTKGETK